MQVSKILEQVPESISLIIEPTQNQGALYLGNITSLYQSVKKYNILVFTKYYQKAVISICEQIDLKDFQLAQHLYIELNDKEDQNILKHFKKTNQFIQDNLNKGNILVHCLAGISRSATIVIAYIMWSQKMSYQKAFLHVVNKRPIVYPNNGFRQQLIQYQQQLKILQ